MCKACLGLTLAADSRVTGSRSVAQAGVQLECGDVITAHCGRDFLDPEMGFCYVAQAGLMFLGLSNSFALASQIAEITVSEAADSESATHNSFSSTGSTDDSRSLGWLTPQEERFLPCALMQGLSQYAEHCEPMLLFQRGPVQARQHLSLDCQVSKLKRGITAETLSIWELKNMHFRRLRQVDHEVRSSRSAWPTWQNPVSIKNTIKVSQAWWQAPVIPATQEAEAGESFEPG
ncbi:hypothetical protein AAY473_016590, partial [Plecturocebus cupreus]